MISSFIVKNFEEKTLIDFKLEFRSLVFRPKYSVSLIAILSDSGAIRIVCIFKDNLSTISNIYFLGIV